MPEVGQHADEQRRPTVRDEQPAGGISGFGVASAILAVIALAAAGLIAVTWSAHRSAAGDRTHEARVLEAAAQWTGILININADNVEDSMARLRDGTIGELCEAYVALARMRRDGSALLVVCLLEVVGVAVAVDVAWFVHVFVCLPVSVQHPTPCRARVGYDLSEVPMASCRARCAPQVPRWRQLHGWQCPADRAARCAQLLSDASLRPSPV